MITSMIIVSKEFVSTTIKKLKTGKSLRNLMATVSKKISLPKSRFHKKKTMVAFLDTCIDFNELINESI